jgi:hypothetical protein
MLARQGDFLRSSEPHLISIDQPPASSVLDQMLEFAGHQEMRGIRSFELAPPPSAFSAHLFRKQGPVANGFVTAFVKPGEVEEKAPVRPVRLVVARVADGQVVDVALLESRSGVRAQKSGGRV